MTRRTNISKKIIALFAAIAVLIVMLFSLVFISVHASHDCTGEECPICAVVAQCTDNVRNIGGIVAAAVCAIFFSLYIPETACPADDIFCTISLISQKVRMNN